MNDLRFSLPCVLVMLAGLTGCSPAPSRYEYAHRQMGTSFRLIFYAGREEAARDAAAAAFARIDELNAVFSDYEASSELSQLSRTAGSGRAVPVSADMWFVLNEAQRMSRLSGGALDITVGPYVRLWRRSRRQGRLPSAARITQTRQSVGFDKIEFHPDTRSVRLVAEGMLLDVGAVAKGFAADQALAVLRRRGLGRALVDAGGDVAAGDPPPDRPGWWVTLRPMVNREVAEAGDPPRIEIRGTAVATSGDAFGYVEIDGVRYSHILDPATGLGLTDRIAVSAVAPDGLTADALASAVSVLGLPRGLALADALPGCSVLVVRRGAGGRIETHRSAGFPELVIPTGDSAPP
ncbi:MAG: FAD:protein FMN transferase [Phycisphaerae bacterium]|nr:FAD:protein FMN transferase [Phycisphaerae bacterium]